MQLKTQGRRPTASRTTANRTTSPALLLVLLAFCLRPTPTSGACREEPVRECEKICSGGGPDAAGVNCSIRALVLLPDDDEHVASLRRVLPILRVAEEQVHRRQLLPAHVRFEWMPQDDKCEAAYAAIKAMDATVKRCSHVLFGPVCDYPLASVGRIAKYFNSEGTPLISVGGFTYDFEMPKTSCAHEFYMLLRTGMLSFETLSELTVAVMKRHDWSRSILFYDPDGQKSVAGLHTCFLMMTSMGKLMRRENMTFAQYPLTAHLANRTEEMRREIGNKHSIIVMCADPHSIRQIMLTAEELNMIDSGEYVFINIELFSRVPHVTSQPWYYSNDTLENNERARKAYTALLTVTPKQPDDAEYIRVSNEIKAIAAAKYNYTFQENEPLSAFVTSFYDGVLLYANALNESIREDPTVLTRPINGSDMVRRMWNRSFTGITGNVTIDANGDRISSYSLLDMNPATGRFEIVAHFLHNRLEYVEGKVIHWAGNRADPPPDTPLCGYDGSLCPDNSLPGYAYLSIALGIVVVVMLVCFFFGYRHYKSEAEINSMSWKVSISDVMYHDFGGRYYRGSFHSLVKHSSQQTLMSEDLGSFSGDRQIFIPVGIYRGCKVAIKAIDERNVNLTRSLMLELKRMKDLQHDHLVKFYGACLNPAKSFLLTEYCPKGSLQDILENEQFQLDWMFKLSLMHDIVRGMQFLHNSDIKSHGNLTSSNCVVDSRFVLKITDFGLHTLRQARHSKGSDVENCKSHAYWSKLLWTAPELLRMDDRRPPEGTQKGDVYSFGIIVHEITTRQGPFYLGTAEPEKSPKEIIELVRGYPHLTRFPFRPLIASQGTYDDINSVMMRCWAEDPAERPDFSTLQSTIRKFNKENETGNIVDNLLKRMEQYANNLEELVEERTQDYIEEKKKCEKLLYQLLPQSVAAQLISGQPVVAETFDQVTIYFSDIVGFTAISAESTPMQVVQFLNDLYTCFDSIVENFDVYKVETIGDAYMVVSGLPIRNGNQHAREIARLALALLEAVHNFKIHHRPDDRLKLRIGLHTGACVAGVVGLKMPRYCLFGDTVNTASRMESNGEALKIHISETTKLALDEFGSFITTRRGFVPMKGKGEQLTYWLEGEVAKADSPIAPNKLLLSRRSSLKQPQRYPALSKQHSTVAALPPPYQSPPSQPQSQSPSQYAHYQHQYLGEGADGRAPATSASSQISPNLRVKRKISSSSPKLNGADFKTEDFNSYLVDAQSQAAHSKPGSLQTSPLQPTAQQQLAHKDSGKFLAGNKGKDVATAAGGRDTSRDSWELANFRLPLSGALKNHNNNNNKISLSQSNSSSNLSGVLQPNAMMGSASKLRLKPSSTISTLVPTIGGHLSADAVSLGGGARVQYSDDFRCGGVGGGGGGSGGGGAVGAGGGGGGVVVEVEEVDEEEEDDDEDEAHPLHNHRNHKNKHPLNSSESESKLNLLRNELCSNSCAASSNNNYSNIVKANNAKNLNLQQLCNNSSNSLAEERPRSTQNSTSLAPSAGGVTQPLLAKN